MRISARVILALLLILASNALNARPRLERISVGHQGQQGDGWSRKAAMSADGRYVVFLSAARNLTATPVPAGRPQWYLRDRLLRSTELLSKDAEGRPMDTPPPNFWRGQAYAAISNDGQTILFDAYAPLVAADTNARTDAYRWRRGQSLELIPTPDPAGLLGSYRLSAVHAMDGQARRILTFCPENAGAVFQAAQICMLELQTGAYTLISGDPQGRPVLGGQESMEFAADGNSVAFNSDALTLLDPPLPTETTVHAYVRDLRTQRTRLAAIGSDGEPVAVSVFEGGISADGRVIVFRASGDNTRPVPSLEQLSVFAVELASDTYQLVSRTPDGSLLEFGSGASRISGNGRYASILVFSLEAAFPFTLQLYRADLATGLLELYSVNAQGIPALPELGGNYDTAERPMGPTFSHDGSLIAFTSTATNLVLGDTNGVEDVFLADFNPTGFAAIPLPVGSASSWAVLILGFLLVGRASIGSPRRRCC